MSNVINAIPQCEGYTFTKRELDKMEAAADVIVIHADREDEPTVYYISLKAPDPKPYHFFGSTAFNWATGETRQQVINKLARMAGRSIIEANVKASSGLYCWTCRVEQPLSGASYDIANYAPQNVTTTKHAEYNIVSARGHVVLAERE